MSTVTLKSAREHRVTAPALARRKSQGSPIAMLTAYDFTFARIFDAVGIDVLLVGDSLGNVVQGHDTTLPVTLDETIYHTRLVARAAQRALVVADMPFGTFQISPEAPGEPPARSALCRVRGAQWLVLSQAEGVEERIEAAADAMRRVAPELAEQRYLPPAVRARLGAGRDAS